MTIHAIFENGVFRPVSPVSLPDRSHVVFDPKLIEPAAGAPAGQERIFAILRQSMPSGETDVAERHDEHQP